MFTRVMSNLISTVLVLTAAYLSYSGWKESTDPKPVESTLERSDIKRARRSLITYLRKNSQAIDLFNIDDRYSKFDTTNRVMVEVRLDSKEDRKDLKKALGTLEQDLRDARVCQVRMHAGGTVTAYTTGWPYDTGDALCIVLAELLSEKHSSDESPGTTGKIEANPQATEVLKLAVKGFERQSLRHPRDPQLVLRAAVGRLESGQTIDEQLSAFSRIAREGGQFDQAIAVKYHEIFSNILMKTKLTENKVKEYSEFLKNNTPEDWARQRLRIRLLEGAGLMSEAEPLQERLDAGVAEGLRFIQFLVFSGLAAALATMILSRYASVSPSVMKSSLGSLPQTTDETTKEKDSAPKSDTHIESATSAVEIDRRSLLEKLKDNESELNMWLYAPFKWLCIGLVCVINVVLSVTFINQLFHLMMPGFTACTDTVRVLLNPSAESILQITGYIAVIIPIILWLYILTGKGTKATFMQFIGLAQGPRNIDEKTNINSESVTDSRVEKSGWLKLGLFLATLDWSICSALLLLHLGLRLPDPPAGAETYGVVLTSREPVAIIVCMLMVVLIGPVLEEVLFRGIIFRKLRSRWTFIPAMIASSALFALAHVQMEPIPFMVRMTLSFLACYGCERTGSIAPGIMAHSFHNLVTAISSFIE